MWKGKLRAQFHSIPPSDLFWSFRKYLIALLLFVVILLEFLGKCYGVSTCTYVLYFIRPTRAFRSCAVKKADVCLYFGS